MQQHQNDNYIYVDLTELRICRHRPDNDNKIISVYIYPYIDRDLYTRHIFKLEQLIGIYWVLKNLRNYDSSPSSQLRKECEIEDCEDQIRHHAEFFNEFFQH